MLARYKRPSSPIRKAPAALTGAIATAAPPAFAQSTGRTFDAADFGAVGDGETINTRPAGLLDSNALRDFLDPRPAPRPRPETWQPAGRDDAQRLAAWLDRQDTDRNLKLFWASCRLAEGGVPLNDALDAVLTAAKSDFGPREITATVRSAYRTVRGEPARHGPSSPPVRGASPQVADGWFRRDASAATGTSRVRGL